MDNEQTTTLAALDASLQSLVKAAARVTGEPLEKGDSVQIDNSGTYGSEGPQGGGQGTMADAGSLEELMVGKMQELGLNAGQISNLIGFMKDAESGSFLQHDRPSPTGKSSGKKPPMPPFKGKADGEYDEDEDEEEDDEDGEEEEATGPAMRGKRKAFGKSDSFKENLLAEDAINELVDVSPYIEAFTSRTADAIDSLAKSQRSIDKKAQIVAKRNDEHFALLAKSLVSLGGVVRTQQNVISELGKRLGLVEAQPAPAKGVQTLSGAKALQKSMPNEVGGGGSRLNKSEMLSVMSYMNLRKGLKDIAGRSVALDLVPNAERGVVPEVVQQEVYQWMRRNPAEVEDAKAFISKSFT